MKIEPTYCTLEQSKLLKEKGFNVECEYFFKKSKHDKKFYLTTGTEYESDKNCIWDWNLNGGQSGMMSKTIPYPNDDSAIYYSAPEQWMVVEWLRVKHNINVEANYLPNISKYRWVAKPMNIIPKSFKTVTEYAIAVDRYYGKENFDTPQAAYSAAIDYVLTNLI